MTMPEATVNTNHFLEPRQHDVRSSGKIFTIEPEPVAHLVNKTPHQFLGTGVAAPDEGHYPAALLNVKLIYQTIASGSELRRRSERMLAETKPKNALLERTPGLTRREDRLYPKSVLRDPHTEPTGQD